MSSGDDEINKKLKENVLTIWFGCDNLKQSSKHDDGLWKLNRGWKLK